MGKKLIALLTDMDEPLGKMTGNFLEAEECYECLDPQGSPELSADLMEVTLELAGRMAVLGGKAATAKEGRTLCETALASGKPRKLFLANIKSQGGDVETFLSMIGNYRSPYSEVIHAQQDGYISRIDAWKTGHAGVGLGVGRNRTEDPVSPTAGIEFHCKAGDAVKKGDIVMTVWGKDTEALNNALPRLADAIEYSTEKPAERKLILKEIQ